MKQLILSCLCVAATLGGYAQPEARSSETTAIVPDPGMNKRDAASPVSANPFLYTSMEVSKDVVIFKNLPDENNIMVYVTDKQGEVHIEKHVSTKDYTVDISGLSDGVHYVTLIGKHTRKAFVLQVQ